MAVCTKCGATSPGKFCASCGSPMPVSADAPRPEYSQQPGFQQSNYEASGQEIPRQAPPQYSSAGQPAILDDNVASALCYSLWLLTGILFLVLEPYKNNRLIRFHAYQSIFTGLALTGVFWVLSSLVFVPGLGLLFSLIFMVYPLAGAILWAVLMYKAYMKERWVLPIVGPLAEKQA